MPLRLSKLTRSLLLAVSVIPSVLAATAGEWKSQTIYQILTDRFAVTDPLPQSSPCKISDQTFCGGTWNAITSKLDYIQSMGFTAIWISPVHKNYDGPRTTYGEAYHGYWVTDIGQLNDRFGTKDDLKKLIAEVHRRGMMIMVDIVVNHVASIVTNPTDYSSYYFKKESQYHPYCPINYGDTHSEQQCWMGDTKVALMDVNTEDPEVVSSYSNWIAQFVQEYQVDGLRLDAAKHIRGSFWPGFCKSAGVFCIGEVYEQDVSKAALWQHDPINPTKYSSQVGGNGSDEVGMDSVLNFPLYWALVDAFGITGVTKDGGLDLTVLKTKMDEVRGGFADASVLGTFLENQDVPRWSGISVDPQSLLNALTFLFMTDGIPIVYYGLEQGFNGGPDPGNREALWPSNYSNTTAVQYIAKLNKLRSWMAGGLSQLPQPSADAKRSIDENYFLQDDEKLFRKGLEKVFGKPQDTDVVRRDGGSDPGFINSTAMVAGASKEVMAIVKGGIIGVVTNIGSPPQNLSFPVLTPYERNVPTTDIFSCVQYAVGSDGIVSVEYSRGGRPIVLVPSVYLHGSGMCGYADATLVGIQSGSVRSVVLGSVGILTGALATLLAVGIA